MPAFVEVPADPSTCPAETLPLRLAYLGRLEKHHKRVLDLGALADALVALDLPFELRVAGEGPARGELAEALAPHLAAGRASLLGPLTLGASRELIAWSHAVVLLSASEGMPTVVMEAMAAARAAAITDASGDAPRLIRDGVEGLVVPTGDMPALAGGLAALARERGRLARMGRAAHLAALVRVSGAALGPSYDGFVAQAARAPDALVGAPDPAHAARQRWLAILEALHLVGPSTPASRRTLAREWCEDLSRVGVRVDAEGLPLDAPCRPGPAERRLRRVVDELLAAGAAPIALYGAGAHTRKVERYVLATPAIVAIIDDRAGRADGPPATLAGRPVLPPAGLPGTGARAVVVSSDEHEREMLPRARGFAPGLVVRGLYAA
jgi:hypothetical protein